MKSGQCGDLQIVLPARMGDSILALPAIYALYKLLEVERHPEVKLYAPRSTFEIIWSLKLFNTSILDLIEKFRSLTSPPSKVFFLDASSNNFGLASKTSFGREVPSKPFLKYTHNRAYLDLKLMESALPQSLIAALRNQHNLSMASIRYFGMLLDLGYSETKILEAFDLKPDRLTLKVKLNNWQSTLANHNYVVICAEAAYGSKREESRRWEIANYVLLANAIKEQLGLLSVFVGTDRRPKLSRAKHILDMRERLTNVQLAQLLKFSAAYVGNDTGPLHLANLLSTPSVGIYLSTTPEQYGPIFHELNRPVVQPANYQVVLENLSKIVGARYSS